MAVDGAMPRPPEARREAMRRGDGISSCSETTTMSDGRMPSCRALMPSALICMPSACQLRYLVRGGGVVSTRTTWIGVRSHRARSAAIFSGGRCRVCSLSPESDVVPMAMTMWSTRPHVVSMRKLRMARSRWPKTKQSKILIAPAIDRGKTLLVGTHSSEFLRVCARKARQTAHPRSRSWRAVRALDRPAALSIIRI